MNITLVIPALNEADYLGACLDSAIRNAQGQIKEIIVVDNGSTDRTSEVDASRRGVRVIYEPRPGLGFARQRGLDEAKNEFIAYIDADTRLPEHWLRMAERLYESYPDTVCLSGPYRYYDGSSFHRTLLNMFW